MLAGGGDEHQLVAALAVPLDACQPLGVEALAQHLLGKAGAERVEPLARLACQRLQGEGHVLVHVHLALMVEGHHRLLLGDHAGRRQPSATMYASQRLAESPIRVSSRSNSASAMGALAVKMEMKCGVMLPQS